MWPKYTIFYYKDIKSIIKEDQILITAVGYPNSGNRMNLIETHLVNDLIINLKW